jgi:hypothetical protein
MGGSSADLATIGKVKGCIDGVESHVYGHKVTKLFCRSAGLAPLLPTSKYLKCDDRSRKLQYSVIH